jgi:hypothetical protein
MAAAVRKDFSLDNAAAARLSLGFGNSSMPALSVFGPPAVDMMMSSRVGGWGLPCCCCCRRRCCRCWLPASWQAAVPAGAL